MTRFAGALVCFSIIATAAAFAQPTPRMTALIEAVKPALPYPAADPSGAIPETGGEGPKWFTVWPTEADETRIVVRANPLHPDTQTLVAKAEGAIQRAVAAAERKAQAAYDRALDELKRTGKAADLDGISLEDEGAAGQRLDADLELTIELTEPASYEIGTSVAPAVTTGPAGVTWQVIVPPNTFQDKAATDRRDRFTASEARLVFGRVARPTIDRLDDRARYAVSIPSAAGGFVIVLRGNDMLLKQVLSTADWTRLAAH